MDWILGICATAIGLGIAATWCAARGEGWRWGSVRASAGEVGDGPYRSGPVIVDQPRRLPPVAAIASVASIAWGVLTMFVFTPAGLFPFGAALARMGQGPVEALTAICFIATIVSGFAISVRLMALGRALMVRTVESADRVRRAAVVAVLHHALVAVSFALFAAGDPPVFWLAAFPCAIGLGLAGLLAAAHATLLRLDREDAARANAA